MVSVVLMSAGCRYVWSWHVHLSGCSATMYFGRDLCARIIFSCECLVPMLACAVHAPFFLMSTPDRFVCRSILFLFCSSLGTAECYVQRYWSVMRPNMFGQGKKEFGAVVSTPCLYVVVSSLTCLTSPVCFCPFSSPAHVACNGSLLR